MTPLLRVQCLGFSVILIAMLSLVPLAAGHTYCQSAEMRPSIQAKETYYSVTFCALRSGSYLSPTRINAVCRPVPTICPAQPATTFKVRISVKRDLIHGQKRPTTCAFSDRRRPGRQLPSGHKSRCRNSEKSASEYFYYIHVTIESNFFLGEFVPANAAIDCAAFSRLARHKNKNK